MDIVDPGKQASRVSRRDKNEGHGIDLEPSKHVKDYKSEYKKRFRPFSQYEYVDGRFFKVKDKEIPKTCSWYEEVVELRKKAGEYKFRGWGTELGTAVLAPTYAQHLWDQVSARTSLDALALISSASKDVIQAEKSAASSRLRSNRPNKPGFPRPHTATPKHPASDLESFKGRKDDENTKIKLRHKQELEQTKPATKLKSRSQSAEPFSRSPMNANIGTFPGGARKERSKDKLSSASERPGPGQKKHLRPTTLMTSPASKKGVHKFSHQDSSGSSVKKPGSESTDYQDIATVKTPPEPTRVKSPDQVILKTPDPVNFVVPLNTQQNLIVTQNIVDSSSECNAFAGNVPGSTHMPMPSYNNQSIPKKFEVQKDAGKQLQPSQFSAKAPQVANIKSKPLDPTNKTQPIVKSTGGPSNNIPTTTSTSTPKNGANVTVSDTVNGKTSDDKPTEVPTTTKDTKIPGKGPRYRVLEDPSVSEDASNSKADPKKLPEKASKGLFTSAKRGFDKLRYKVKN